jgi:hypothetical protein
MTCHVEFHLTTFLPQKPNTPQQPYKKNTTQQQHNTTTSLKRIILTMAKTASVPRGSTPPTYTPPKRNKQDSTDDASNDRKHQKNTNSAKGKQALEDTSCKTGAETVQDIVKYGVTCNADPDSLGNAQPNKQQPGQQSQETTESNESNAVNYFDTVLVSVTHSINTLME